MLLSALLSLLFVADTVRPALDGPYVFLEPDTVAYYADIEGRQKVEAADFDYGKLRHFVMSPQVIFDGVKKVAVLSDIHGQYETAVRLFQLHGIIDEELNWSFDKGHAVIVGDVFDRGDRVTEMLWLIHDLMPQARDAGGKLHFLLGNHETMILKGDERYVNKKYRYTTALLGKTYTDLYGPDTYLGHWLRSLPIAVKINDYVYVHGGINRDLAYNMPDLMQMNLAYKRDLERLTHRSNRTSGYAENSLHGRSGPLWYRGYFSPGTVSLNDIKYVLKRYGAKKIIVGHTSFRAITSFFNGRVIGVDSSIKMGTLGEILLIEDGKIRRGTLLGEHLKMLERGTPGVTADSGPDVKRK